MIARRVAALMLVSTLGAMDHSALAARADGESP
jgi:hypothetical protein